MGFSNSTFIKSEGGQCVFQNQRRGSFILRKIVTFILNFEFFINKMMRKDDYKFKSNNIKYSKYFMIKNMI